MSYSLLPINWPQALTIPYRVFQSKEQHAGGTTVCANSCVAQRGSVRFATNFLLIRTKLVHSRTPGGVPPQQADAAIPESKPILRLEFSCITTPRTSTLNPNRILTRWQTSGH